MTETGTDPNHFTQAVIELGEKISIKTTQAIFNDRGVKIVNQGVAINASLYERLIAHKLSVPLENLIGSDDTITGLVLRKQAQQAMREVPFFARISTDAKICNLLLDIMEKLPLPDAIAFQLLLASQVHPEWFRHSIHSALFAAWLTHVQGPVVSRFDVSMAAAAGLLCDLGMLHIDPALLSPQGFIGRDKRRQLYSHPLVTMMLVERHHVYPRELIRGIKEHHEFLDGSGYPSHLRGNAISPLGRILSLTELVTTMLATASPTAELHLGLKLRMNPHRYDATLVTYVERGLMISSEIQIEGYQEGIETVMAEPVRQLLAINVVLSDWPAALVRSHDLSAVRREGMVAVDDQVLQLRRTLANAGVEIQQLNQLKEDTLDHFFQLELTLLAQEATWQLRALIRHVKRRWGLPLNAHYPDVLQMWLDQAEALVIDA